MAEQPTQPPAPSPVERMMDQPSMSVEEARRLLEERKAFPAAAENVFGKKNIQEFLRLTHHPAVQDIDQMFLAGSVELDEIMDYIGQLPEYRTIQREFSALTQSFVKAVESKLPYYAGAALDRRGDFIFDVDRNKLLGAFRESRSGTTA